jgi:hypothetical protein
MAEKTTLTSTRGADKKAKKGLFKSLNTVFTNTLVEQAANAREKRRMVRMNEAFMR